MNRILKTAGIMLLTGVLLMGVGTGIAVAEGAAFTYGGTYEAGSGQLVTEQLDFTFEPQEGEKIFLGEWAYWNERREGELTEDPSVPVNTIRYEVTYDPETVNPYLYERRMEDYELEYTATPSQAEEAVVSGVEVWLETESLRSDMEVFLECKDHFLRELKERKISSYHMTGIERVEVKVNPETVSCIQISR
ncbi:MAG TPA: hypothetical protein H9740_04265 [Candidatus Hungatella pullicola]|nr:hypothetical protein [Candidatus Hungatella pullicola]